MMTSAPAPAAACAACSPANPAPITRTSHCKLPISYDAESGSLGTFPIPAARLMIGSKSPHLGHISDL